MLSLLMDDEPCPVLNAIFLKLFIHDMITRHDNPNDVWLSLNLHPEYLVALFSFEHDLRIKQRMYKYIRHRRNKTILHNIYHRLNDKLSGTMSMGTRLIRFISGTVLVIFMIALALSMLLSGSNQHTGLLSWLSRFYGWIFTGI